MEGSQRLSEKMTVEVWRLGLKLDLNVEKNVLAEVTGGKGRTIKEKRNTRNTIIYRWEKSTEEEFAEG